MAFRDVYFVYFGIFLGSNLSSDLSHNAVLFQDEAHRVSDL